MNSFLRLVRKFIKNELSEDLAKDFVIENISLLQGINYVAAWSFLLPRGISSDGQLNLMLALAWRVNLVLRISPPRFAFHFDFVGNCLNFYIFLVDLEELALVKEAVLDIRHLDSIPASADHVAFKRLNKDSRFFAVAFKLKNQDLAESQRQLFLKLMNKFGVPQIWSAPGEIRLVPEYWRNCIAKAPDIMHF